MGLANKLGKTILVGLAGVVGVAALVSGGARQPHFFYPVTLKSQPNGTQTAAFPQVTPNDSLFYAVLTISPGVDGAERVLATLPDGMQGSGYQVTGSCAGEVSAISEIKPGGAEPVNRFLNWGTYSGVKKEYKSMLFAAMVNPDCSQRQYAAKSLWD